jgi:uncharacterized protein
MRDFRDAKAMAQTLRDTLKTKSVTLTHSESLELVAKILGFHDWNVLSAKIEASRPAPDELVELRPSTPMPIASGTILPIIPMRDIVFFPQMVAPLFVGRDSAKRAIEHALGGNSTVLAIAQRRAGDDDPKFDDLQSMGVTASVVNRIAMRDGTFKVIVSGIQRARILKSVEGEFLAGEIALVEDVRTELSDETIALSRAVLEAYQAYAKHPAARFLQMYAAAEPGQLADAIAPLLQLLVGVEKVQQLLETNDVVKRLEIILELIKTDKQAA